MLGKITRSLVFAALLSSVSIAQDYINHNSYQAVDSDGSSSYDGTFPIKLIGVVLNNTEDWLNPTAAETPSTIPYDVDGEAEFYIQAVNLDGTAYDTDPGSAFNDFGGTACWMGQSYSNVTGESTDSYSASEWYSELDRLGIWRTGTSLSTDQQVRAGDLVEVTVNVGMAYKGKMNVNETHSNDEGCNFSVEILEKSYGLPDATTIELSDVKDAENVAIFDETRTSGGEFYQSTLVELTNVRFTDVTGWGCDGDFTVTDDDGRTLSVHIGLNDSFDSMETPMTDVYYNLTGIFDQQSTDRVLGVDGYRLLVMNASSIVAIPEPTSLTIIALLATGLAKYKKRKKS